MPVAASSMLRASQFISRRWAPHLAMSARVKREMSYIGQQPLRVEEVAQTKCHRNVYLSLTNAKQLSAKLLKRSLPASRDDKNMSPIVPRRFGSQWNFRQ